MDGDTSELDLSDNDDDILDASYQPQPQEQSSTEDESSGDEYPIPHPTEQSRGRKRLRGEDNGACPCRQYLPMKPNPVGIKNFVCATTDDFDLYQGSAALREQVEEPEGLGLGSLIMACLCKTLHRGTKVYCDRLFTSIQGAEQMLKKELYITGTVMKNRVTAAVQKLPTDKTMQTSGRGTSKEVSSEDGQLCVVKWFDNKPVLMISAVHGTQPEDTCQRWDKKQKKYVSVSRPCIVREYNIKMGGVDLIDRMISYFRMSSRTKKWTIRMLMHFTDLALANSWLLYRKDLATCGAPRKSIMQFLEFRMDVARTFLAQHHSQEEDADSPELSEGDDDSSESKKRPVMAVPHVSVRRRANAHLPEMIQALLKLKNLDPEICNVVQIHAAFFDRGYFCFVFEYLDKSLFDYMVENDFRPLPLEGIRLIVQQLAVALQSLRSVGLTHCDIKLDNIMLVDHEKQPFRIKLIDFGLADVASSIPQGSVIQALSYRSPEVLLGLPLTEAVDMWSLGCVVGELHLGDRLFDGNNEYDMMRSIVELLGQPPNRMLDAGIKTNQYFKKSLCPWNRSWKLKTHLKQNSSDKLLDSLDDLLSAFRTKGCENPDLSLFVDMLKKMLDLDPATRITPAQLLQHGFLTNTEVGTTCKEPEVTASKKMDSLYSRSVKAPSTTKQATLKQGRKESMTIKMMTQLVTTPSGLKFSQG
ncbi:Homeodomain-interacting protein kinase 2 [Takifugu flavidus]|uniref:Homeodomain-interacting protein kinase 2 n=1 Tax=Takifugu flavidus TaxID=433684 RepID=A0A5C6NPW1_9TELE|nr:Homeodomain-interacting protein kinase 2 [Takifugu flavidus]